MKLAVTDQFLTIASEVVDWLPKLVAGHCSIVIYGLAIVYLYIQFLRQLEHTCRKSRGTYKKALKIISEFNKVSQYVNTKKLILSANL